MSEFACVNGHLMLSSHGRYCPICGCPVHTMDGLTSSQHRKLEEMLEAEEGEEEVGYVDSCARL